MKTSKRPNRAHLFKFEPKFGLLSHWALPRWNQSGEVFKNL
ncbi:hypothetical protein F3D3_4624 [Fusibacter sp. 3D3]|nr:hypothetical protein F3D3_4624 [Fusibacter sp. 3D3]